MDSEGISATMAAAATRFVDRSGLKRLVLFGRKIHATQTETPKSMLSFSPLGFATR